MPIRLLIQSDATGGTFTVAVRRQHRAPTSASSDAATRLRAVTTANMPPVAQTDTLTLGGTVGPGEIGDTYTLTIGTQSISYVADGTETSLSDLATRFAAQINANPGLGVTATAAAGVISLTAINAGVPFTSSATATNGTVPGLHRRAVRPDRRTTAGTVVAVSQPVQSVGQRDGADDADRRPGHQRLRSPSITASARRSSTSISASSRPPTASPSSPATTSTCRA